MLHTMLLKSMLVLGFNIHTDIKFTVLPAGVQLAITENVKTAVQYHIYPNCTFCTNCEMIPHAKAIIPSISLERTLQHL